MGNNIISIEKFKAAKRAFDPDKLARAIMERAEEEGKSVTEWLKEHAEECACGECPDKKIILALGLYSGVKLFLQSRD
jgi:hypothetical protein